MFFVIVPIGGECARVAINPLFLIGTIVVRLQQVGDTLPLGTQLKRLAEKCRKPKPHQINLVGIWEETRNMGNKEVAKTIDEVYKNYFTHGIDRSKINQLHTERYTNPACYQPGQAELIDKHFIKELQLGRYIVNPEIEVKCRVPFFMKYEGGTKYRMIPDYTWPKSGSSVNSLIAESEGKVDLMDKTELIKFIHNDGKTNTLGKNDYKSWYRQFPMNKLDWPISVYHWRGIDFHDTYMPWGTRRASKIAHHFSIAISYISYKYIPRALQPCIFNYIDDHIFRANSIPKCLYVHVIYIFVCIKYSIQLNLTKTKLYAMKLIGLGILFDMIHRRVALTPNRKEDLKSHLQKLAVSQTVTAKYAQQCAGKCEDVAFMLYPLRVYLRHLRNAIPFYKDENQTVRINDDIINACQNWIRAIEYIKGRNLTRVLNIPEFTQKPMFTDGSNAGFGAIHDTHWMYGAFHPSEIDTKDKNNIVERELYPVLIMCQLFGPSWNGHKVKLYIDNDNAMRAIVNKDIRREKAHRLLIRIFEEMMKFKFEIFAVRIDTDDNVLADSLSRLEIKKFLNVCTKGNIPIDPAPMLYQRPPFEIGRIENTAHPPTNKQ